MSYHLIPARMATIKKSTNDKCWQGGGEKGTLVYCCWVIMEIIMENSTEFPQNLKIELPFDPVIPLIEIYPKNPETPIRKNICTPMFIAALL